MFIYYLVSIPVIIIIFKNRKMFKFFIIGMITIIGTNNLMVQHEESLYIN
jgi:hypothetical protein